MNKKNGNHNGKIEIKNLLGSVSFKKAIETIQGITVEKRLLPRTVEIKNFDFDYETGTIVWKDGKKEPYYLTIEGLVENPIRLSYNELLSLPMTKQVSDFHCVEGWSVLDIEWEGIRFENLFELTKLKDDAFFATFHSFPLTDYAPQGIDHYIESLPVADLLNPEKEILLALKMNGKPLDKNHGCPARVISPYDLAYKSIKYVTKIELTENRVDGWWTLANPIYPPVAPVPLERIRKKEKKR